MFREGCPVTQHTVRIEPIAVCQISNVLMMYYDAVEIGQAKGKDRQSSG